MKFLSAIRKFIEHRQVSPGNWNQGNYQPPEELRFAYNVVKGDLAESLVTQLFIRGGYEVYPCGIEHSTPALVQHLHKSKSTAYDKLRQTPDLIVRNNKTGEVFWIEVKYRRDGQISDGDRRRLETYTFPEAYWLLVSRDKLLIAKAENLKKGVNFSLLRGRREFNLDESLIEEVTRWAQIFYDGA